MFLSDSNVVKDDSGILTPVGRWSMALKDTKISLHAPVSIPAANASTREGTVQGTKQAPQRRRVYLLARLGRAILCSLSILGALVTVFSQRGLL